MVVSGEMSYADDISALERFRLEPRAFLLILAGVQTFAGLDLPQGKLQFVEIFSHQFTS